MCSYTVERSPNTHLRMTQELYIKNFGEILWFCSYHSFINEFIQQLFIECYFGPDIMENTEEKEE